jgi:hypothetical protein
MDEWIWVDGQDTFFIWLLFPIAEDSKSVAQVLKTGKQGGAVVAAGSHPRTNEVKSVNMGLSPLRPAVGLINSTPLRIPKGSFIHR